MIQNLLYGKDPFRTNRSVEDPHWFTFLNADPDPALYVNTDPDPRF
jgi:hypothetical protein